ncbi:hypothetical protein [Actinomadura napierensis]|uniref:Uncharacterized protein n=1 Tax=Actinomadura napierensis TaxID=267854 RepID=A0ABN2ZWE3_9ACTN
MPGLEPLGDLLLELSRTPQIQAAMACDPEDSCSATGTLLIVSNPPWPARRIAWTGVFVWHGGDDDGQQIGRTVTQAAAQIRHALGAADADGASPGPMPSFTRLPPYARAAADVETLCTVMFADYTGDPGARQHDPLDVVEALDRHGLVPISNTLTMRIFSQIEDLVSVHGLGRAQDIMRSRCMQAVPEESRTLHRLMHQHLRGGAPPQVPEDHQVAFLTSLLLLHTLLQADLLHVDPPAP